MMWEVLGGQFSVIRDALAAVHDMVRQAAVNDGFLRAAARRLEGYAVVDWVLGWVAVYNERDQSIKSQFSDSDATALRAAWWTSSVNSARSTDPTLCDVHGIGTIATSWPPTSTVGSLQTNMICRGSSVYYIMVCGYWAICWMCVTSGKEEISVL